MKKNYFLIIFIVNALFIFNSSTASEVNVYSYRQPILIDPFFEEFTKLSGIKVNVLHAKKGLLERLLSEGANTPADIVLTVDISRLKQFVEEDVLIPIESSVLENNIPLFSYGFLHFHEIAGCRRQTQYTRRES